MIKLVARNQIWMLEIGSKLIVLSKENKLVKLHTSAIVYRPFDIKKVINIVDEIIDSQRNNKPNLKQPESLTPHAELTFNTHPQFCDFISQQIACPKTSAQESCINHV